MNKKEQLAYFAGLLDGEGCIGVWKFRNSAKQLRYRAAMSIAMTDKEPILWLFKTFGGGTYLDKKIGKTKSKVCHLWKMNAGDAARLLSKALPLLLVKKKQALNLIKFSKTLSGPGGLGEAKPISFALLKKRKRLADVSTKLNRKGRIL